MHKNYYYNIIISYLNLDGFLLFRIFQLVIITLYGALLILSTLFKIDELLHICTGLIVYGLISKGCVHVQHATHYFF